jgi:hypothetical protein
MLMPFVGAGLALPEGTQGVPLQIAQMFAKKTRIHEFALQRATMFRPSADGL